MAGWSKIVDGFSLESFKAVQKVQKIEIWFDPEPFSEKLTIIQENGRNNTYKQFKLFLNEFLEVFLIGILCCWPLSAVFSVGRELICTNSCDKEIRV